jgi:hypothetical protein
MANLVHLDEAARLVGKSEITLRRLAKSGKVPVQREKTLTGFYYLIDPDVVRSYYEQKSGFRITSQPPKTESKKQPAATAHAVQREGHVRVAVSGDGGDPALYWARRAETFEERYHDELKRSGELREELGLWRGRAEHAQALLLKLLPAPMTVEIGGSGRQTEAIAEQERVTVRRLTFAGTVIMVALPLLLVIGFTLMYLGRN